MIVACPSCKTRYALPDSSVSGEGRQVRCARCGHQWFFTKPAAKPEETAAPEEDALAEAVLADAAEAATAEANIDTDAEDGNIEDDSVEDEADEAEAQSDQEPVEEPEDPWERRNRRAGAGSGLPNQINNPPTMPDASTTQSGGMKKAVGWLAVLVLVAGTGFIGHAYRESIVNALPQSQVVYKLLGYSFEGPLDGLSLPEVVSTRSLENGSSVLVVEGRVANSSEQNKRLPTLKATLMDAEGVFLYETTFKPDIGVVAAGAEVPFRQVFINPDPRASEVEVSLVAPKPAN